MLDVRQATFQSIIYNEVVAHYRNDLISRL